MLSALIRLLETFRKYFKSLHSIIANNFLKNASQMISGTVTAQFIIILTAPILTRLFAPDEMGILAIFAALVAILGSLSTLRYEIAIPLVRKSIEASSLLLLSILVNLAYSLLVGLVLYFFHEPILDILNAQVLSAFLWTIPVAIFFNGLVKSFTYWALRNESFSDIAITRIQQGGGMAIAQITLGFLNYGVFGLIIGYVFGFLSGLTRLIFHWYKTGSKLILNHKFNMLKAAGIEHRDLPLYSNWGALINVIGLQLPIIMFASFFSPYLAGLYMLAQRVANAPVQLIAESVGKVFYISAIKESKNGDLLSLVKTIFQLLVKISIFPFIFIALISPDLFYFVFGSEWEEAGVYLQFMVIWLLSSFIFVPLMTLFAVLNRHKMDLNFQTSLVVVRVIGILIGAAYESAMVSIAAFSIFSAIIYTVYGCWLLNQAKLTFLSQMRILLKEAWLPLLFLIAVMLFNLVANLPPLEFLQKFEILTIIILFIPLYIYKLMSCRDLLMDLKKISI